MSGTADTNTEFAIFELRTDEANAKRLELEIGDGMSFGSAGLMPTLESDPPRAGLHHVRVLAGFPASSPQDRQRLTDWLARNGFTETAFSV